jgi:hypothetical protein
MELGTNGKSPNNLAACQVQCLKDFTQPCTVEAKASGALSALRIPIGRRAPPKSNMSLHMRRAFSRMGAVLKPRRRHPQIGGPNAQRPKSKNYELKQGGEHPSHVSDRMPLGTLNTGL